MNYGPYGYGMQMPYGMNQYNPQPSQQQQMPTQFIQQTQQQPQPQSSNLDWIHVSTMADVQNVSVQPGSKAWIMLTSEPIFVLKVANQMGLTTTEAYRFEKVDAEKPDYITRQEFNAFVESLSASKSTPAQPVAPVTGKVGNSNE